MIAWSEAGGATSDSDAGANGVFTRKIPGGPVRLASRPPGSKPFLLPGASVASPDDGIKTISANGRYIVFEGYSSRLGSLPYGEVFRRDLATGKVELASRRSGARGARSKASARPSVSSDGNRVAFISYYPLVAADADSDADAYVRDFTAKTTTLVSRANGAGGVDSNESVDSVAISGNGRRVVFAPGDQPRGYQEVTRRSTSVTLLRTRRSSRRERTATVASSATTNRLIPGSATMVGPSFSSAIQPTSTPTTGTPRPTSTFATWRATPHCWHRGRRD